MLGNIVSLSLNKSSKYLIRGSGFYARGFSSTISRRTHLLPKEEQIFLKRKFSASLDKDEQGKIESRSGRSGDFSEVMLEDSIRELIEREQCEEALEKIEKNGSGNVLNQVTTAHDLLKGLARRKDVWLLGRAMEIVQTHQSPFSLSKTTPFYLSLAEGKTRSRYTPRSMQEKNVDPNLAIKVWSEKTDNAILNEIAKMDPLVEMELSFETAQIDKAVQKYHKITRAVNELGKGSSLRPSERIIHAWLEPLTKAIENRKMEIQLGSPRPPLIQTTDASIYLLVPSVKLALITLHTVFGLLLKNRQSFGQQGISMKTAAFAISEAMLSDARYNRIIRSYKNKIHLTRKGRMSSPFFQNIDETDEEEGEIEIESESGLRVGLSLLEDLVISTTVPETNTPAFSRKYVKEDIGLHASVYLHLNETLYRIIEADFEFQARNLIRTPLMVVPPIPWKSPTKGAYYVLRSKIMRSVSFMQDSLLKKAEIPQIMQGLNLLSNVSWKINEPIYRVAMGIWDSGGGIAEIPSRNDFSIPENLPRKKQKELKQKNQDLHSLRSDMLLKLELAKRYLNLKFYMPHNMDFRGRAYPMPPHLNHLGSDLTRGLLLFHEGRPLGKNGLRWIKIHLANLCGKDKLSQDQRVEFTDSMIDLIFDSADKPLDGHRWWLDAEDPWQCLATCMEITKALRSDNIEKYISHLPIHRDGTCNGLQHYAALGRDIEGGEQVNLVPSPIPRDVYGGVATRVNARIDADAKEGNRLAKKLAGKVTRRTIKQTVMTYVYGVTAKGARDQVKLQLKDLVASGDLNQKDLFPAAAYIANHTFASIETMFENARNIMEWLRLCAGLLAREGEPVTWITPLNLPVAQPYRTASKKKNSASVIRGKAFSVALSKEDELPISFNKQRSAFPANFIHSLDSTHMFLTCLKANQENLTFAAVHDSFWTHASSADVLNSILRTSFIELHHGPILENLLDRWRIQFPHISFPDVPSKGELDLNVIRDSLYFFN